MKGLFSNNKSIRGVFLGSSIARLHLKLEVYKSRGYISVHPTANTLTYNGSAQLLCTSGQGTGTIMYSLDGTTYTSTIPSQTNAGTYTIYYKAAESGYYQESETQTISISISKATPTVVAPTAKVLTYNTQSQELVNAGSTNFGTLQYSLDDETYGTSIPSVTNAGNYTVYYKVVGDNNINNAVTQSISCSIGKANRNVSFVDDNGHSDYVEIGGLLWAKKNIGASSITDTGLYFQWGDSIGYTAEQVGPSKKHFLWTDYKYGNGTSSPSAADMTKYNSTDGKTVLEASDDAATANWGGYWRMSTTTELQALGNAVNTTWTDNYNSSGVAGIICTDKTDSSKVLFFPAGGWCDNYNVKDKGNRVHYWTSSLYSDKTMAYENIFSNTGSANWQLTGKRSIGLPVRGVIKPLYQTKLVVGNTNTILVFTAGNPTITVTSSNTSVATVNGMTVNAVSVGTTTITATVASDINYNSSSVSYSLEVVWNGVYAYYSDGSMRTAGNADTNAIGVAVITDNCKFIIDKTNETAKAWDSRYSTNGIIAGCFAAGDTDTAKTDYAGVSNTNAIAAVTNGGEAAKYCRSCSKTIAGKTVYGYLGACGEWLTAYDNKTTINSIMSIIGGTAITDRPYWSSTLHNSSTSGGWFLKGGDGTVTYNPKNISGKYVKPFYKIS